MQKNCNGVENQNKRKIPCANGAPTKTRSVFVGLIFWVPIGNAPCFQWVYHLDILLSLIIITLARER